MKNSALYCFLVAMLLLNTSCELATGIFKAGMVWGILLVVIVLATIIALIARSKK